MKRFLVTGGTGLVGRPTVRRLLDAGHSVRILSRHASEDAREWPERVEGWQASVADPESLAGAADGCDAAIHIVGVAREAPPEVTFERINVHGTRNVLAECGRAGVQRFVYLSSLGAARGSSAYHRSKKAAEDLVRGYFGRWLILRPGNVYGPGDEVISRYLRMVRKLPAVPLLGDGSRQFQPIWAGDLAEAIARAAMRESPAQQALEVAGNDCVSMNDLLGMLEEITGQSPVRIPVPEWAAKHGGRAAEAVGIDTPMTEDQVTMVLEDNFLLEEESNALTEVFGIEPLPIEEGLVRLADSLPERLPASGEGTLFQHRYWVDIRGSRYSADELFALVREQFPELAPETLMEVGAEPGTPETPELGMNLTLAIPLRGNIQVRVVEIADRTITCATVEGHFLSGVIRFFVEERNDEERQGGEPVLRFEIRSYARPSDLADRLAMRTFGRLAQKATWEHVVGEVLKRSEGEAVEGVQTEARALKGEDAKRVEAWADEIVRRHHRKEAREAEGGEGD